MPHRISRDRALPLDLFADEAVFDLEMRQIWHRDWIFATAVDLVAEAGDQVPVMIGDQPVIVVRGDDLRIRAFANACAHRGAPLVDCPARGSRMSCPYHGWTYGLDGQLVSVPYTVPDEIDTSTIGLTEHRCEVWHGLVFVSLDPNVVPLADRLATVDPYVKSLAITRLHHHSEHDRAERWQANWKAIHANTLDSYSHFRLHADTVEPSAPTDGAYYLAGSAEATVTGGESFDRADYLVVSVPPSFVAVVHSNGMVWHSLVPQSVASTVVRSGVAHEDVSPGSDSVGWDPASWDEDRAICESLQRNARARATLGPLLGLERAVGDFHDFLRNRLTDAPTTPPFVAAPPGSRPEAG